MVYRKGSQQKYTLEKHKICKLDLKICSPEIGSKYNFHVSLNVDSLLSFREPGNVLRILKSKKIFKQSGNDRFWISMTYGISCNWEVSFGLAADFAFDAPAVGKILAQKV